MANNTNQSRLIFPCYHATRPDWFNFFSDGIFPSFLLVFGVAGILYSWRRLRRNTTKLFTHLLFLYNWDFLFLVSVFGFYGFSSVTGSPVGQKAITGPSVYLYMIFYPLVSLAMTGSMWTLVVISVERFLALSQPLKHHSRDQNRISLIVRIAVVLGSFVVTFPRIFELTTRKCLDGRGRGLDKQISPSKLRMDPNFQLIYRVICNAIFVSPLPFLVVAVVTFKTWLIRRRALRSRRKQSMTRERRGSDKTSALLLALVVKFLVCQSCPTLLNLAELIYEPVRRTAWFNHLISISNLLVCINCATNWLLFIQLPKPAEDRTTTIFRTSTFMNVEDLDGVGDLWPKENCYQIGSGLVQACVVSNPLFRQKLNEFFCSDSPRSDRHNSKIGELLHRMFSLALKGQSLTEAQPQLSEAVRAHIRHGIVLRNTDWLAIKRYLLEQFGERLNDEKQQQLNNRLVSWVVKQLKRELSLHTPSPSPFERRLTWSNSDLGGRAAEQLPLLQSGRQLFASRNSEVTQWEAVL